MQLFFRLVSFFLLGALGTLILYVFLINGLRRSLKIVVKRARQEVKCYRPEIGHLYSFALLCSITAVLMAYLLVGNPVYGLPAIPLFAILSLPLVSFQKEQRRFEAERAAINFLHGLHGLLQGGLALPAALKCLTERENSIFDSTLQTKLRSFSKGTPIREVLAATRRTLGLESVNVCLTALELAYEKGLSISPVLSDALPSLEAEAEMYKKTRNLRKTVAVQAAIACGIPWALLGVLYWFQPETVELFFTTPSTGLVVGVSLLWAGLGVGLLWQVSEFY